ncbi:hypothetical protein, partial [Aedoeadaptatus coxii]|uniref:hypothetical protein n=1 Tax=Aedoeadaptatus coxii TaxID=755172 RepID=UPI002AA2A80A
NSPSPADPNPIPAGFLMGRKCLRHFLHLMLLKQKDTLFNYSKIFARSFQAKAMLHSKNSFLATQPNRNQMALAIWTA